MQEDKITKEEAEDRLEEYFGEGSIFGNYEERIHKLKSLIEIAKVINSSLEKESLLQAILLACQGQFFLQNVSIFLYDELESTYNLESSIGIDVKPFSISFIEDDPLIQLLKEEVSYLRISDDLKDPQYSNVNDLNEKLLGQVIIPLRIKNKLNGIIVIGNRIDAKEFSYDDLYYLKIFAELASVSVENMILFQLVTMDRMTKLFNHHYFQGRLVDEIYRSVRYDHELSLIMLDIDHFKNFNDTYGHQEGDFIIKTLSKLLKNTVRITDIVSRYGGEEFTIILPETNIEDAQIIAEKIRSTINDHQFLNNKNEYKVTISLGLANIVGKNYDKPIMSTELIEKADQALYLSKKTGRNKVSLYSEVETSKL